MKIFDAHFHIIDFQYPITPNNGYTPPEFTSVEYKKAQDKYQIEGGAIVSGSFQAFDQTYLKDALDHLGDNFYGVANIPHQITDAELLELQQKNVTAVRFNLKRGGSTSIDHIDYLSNKLNEEFGWHTEFYLDSKDLPEIQPQLNAVKNYSIDHLGLSKAGLKDLYKCVEKGVKVKATGFGRIDFNPIDAMKQIHSINPNALMFGTDLPSTRAKTPFSDQDIKLIQDNFDESAQQKILYSNAKKWYAKK